MTELRTTGYKDAVPLIVGHRLVSLEFADDKSSLTLNFDDDSAVKLECEGDCCSQTWIEHISGVKQVLGQTITAIENVAMPEGVEDAEFDYLQFYGIKFRTNIGDLFIEYRNSSNGYYGGSLEARPIESTGPESPLLEDV